MVSETTENIGKFFETITASYRKAGDTMLGTQKAWASACSDACKGAPVSEMFGAPQARFAEEFGPFVAKNVETMADCFDAGVKTGMNMFKTACDAGSASGDADVHDRTRRVWDTAFKGMRDNFDALETAGKRSAGHWSDFCSATCRTSDAAKTSQKSPK